MKKIKDDQISLILDDSKLNYLTYLIGDEAQTELAKLWDEDKEFLTYFLAIYYKKGLKSLSYQDSFITLAYRNHGYVVNPEKGIDILEAEKQIKIDLEIISKESRWSNEDAIYFGSWWPKPSYDKKNHTLTFGIALRDYEGKIINRTLNQLILTRYGHLEINYSLSIDKLNENQPMEYYLGNVQEIRDSITIEEGYRYQDINEDTDFPSRSEMINLLLSAEIF